MDKPKQSLTDEFRKWSKARFMIRKYLNDTLGIPNYGHKGGAKHYWYKREGERYERDLKERADVIAANALTLACPPDVNPYKFCEELFGIEAEIETITGNKTKPNKSPAEQIEHYLDQMDEETKEEFKKILEQGND